MPFLKNPVRVSIANQQVAVAAKAWAIGRRPKATRPKSIRLRPDQAEVWLVVFIDPANFGQAFPNFIWTDVSFNPSKAPHFFSTPRRSAILTSRYSSSSIFTGCQL